MSVAEIDDYVKMLVYGVPGIGKTMLACSAAAVPEMCPVLLIDIEGGSKTIRSLFPNISRIRVKDELDGKGLLKKSAWHKLQDVYEELTKGVAYKTIIIDSLTEAQKMAMYSVMSQTVKQDPTRDLDIPAQRDWGKSGEMVRRMVRAFRDLDAHVIFTALENRNQDQQSGKVTITPSLPGKLAFEIAAFLDEVFYMYTKIENNGGIQEIRRLILTQPTDKQIAKDRSGNLPLTLSNPTMSDIAEAVLD